MSVLECKPGFQWYVLVLVVSVIKTFNTQSKR
jgi:hypothetical protein